MLEVGLINLKNKIKGEHNIYSLLQQSEIKQGKLSQIFRRSSWNSLINNSFYRHPKSLKKMKFMLQVMFALSQDMNSEAQITIDGIKQSALSGALTEVFAHKMRKPTYSNGFLRFLVKFYNFCTSRLPFGAFLSPSSIGIQSTVYSV